MTGVTRRTAAVLELIATVAIGIFFMAVGLVMLFAWYSVTCGLLCGRTYSWLNGVVIIIVGFAFLGLAVFRARMFSRKQVTR